jgi:N,N-dimethylformamidase
MATPIKRFRFLFADDRSLYGIAATGELLWYPAWTDPATPPNLADGRQIGVGWAGFDHVFPGGDGILYAVHSDGALLWYRDLFRNGTNAPDGSFGWDANSGNQIGQGWTGFANLFSGDNGIIYAIRPDGPLLWYQDLNRDGSNAPDGSSGWAANSGHQIGSGWSGFRHVVPGGGGIIYLVNAKGELLWYRDEFRNGSNDPSGATGWAAASGSKVGSGWDFFTHLFGGDTGLIYACRTTEFGGAMRRYLDLFLDGSNGPGGAGWDVAVAESSTGWQVPAIEGYCWPMSVSPGETLRFHVSASIPGRARVSYLRLGGRGPRLGVLVENGPEFDAAFQSSGMFAADCEWPMTFELTPNAAHWSPGFYAARVGGVAGAPYDIPFVVKRGVEPAPLALLVNVNTWNAYNSWGGASNYTDTASPIDLTHKRPNHHLLTSSQDHSNGNHMLRSEIWMHSWLKAQGYEVDLYTDIDLENGIDGLADYKALILSTHPEYWSQTMMQRVSGYLDAGGRLLYLGGNAHYRPTSLRAQAPGGDVDLMTSEITLWGSFPRYEGKPLLAAESANLGGPGRGNGYTISNPHHRFMPGGLLAGQLMGLTGWNGTPGAPWGASGWETDHWAAPPGDVAVLARDTIAPAGGVIACFETGAGGFVLGVGSLTFVGSLQEDAVLQQIVNAALAEALNPP